VVAAVNDGGEHRTWDAAADDLKREEHLHQTIIKKKTCCGPYERVRIA